METAYSYDQLVIEQRVSPGYMTEFVIETGHTIVEADDCLTYTTYESGLEVSCRFYAFSHQAQSI